MSDWHIRLARDTDAAGMAETETDAATLFAELDQAPVPTLPPARSDDEYRRIIARGRSLSAMVGEDVIGFAAAQGYGRELHLHELSVRRSYQRSGVGTVLLNALAVDAINTGFRAITLNTFRAVPWNAPFYRRHGFVDIDDLDAHPRLKASMEKAEAAGLPLDSRVAMIRFLANG